jgi:D-alanyl-D-alanine carboxypeptidase
MKKILLRVAIAVVALSLTSLSACSSSTATQSGSPVDLDALMTQIDAEVVKFLNESGAPGATIAILFPDGKGGVVERTTTAGFSNVIRNQKTSPKDHYRFGSITKTMTSAVVLQLAQEGLIELDAPVSTYLGMGWAKGYTYEGTDYGDIITVRQILNHTDGFAEFAFDAGFYLEAGARLTTPYEPEEIVAWGVKRGPQYEPGNGYLYNTVGHVIAGLVIEEVTGKTAEEVLRTRLFDPVNADDAYLAPTKLAPEDGVAGYVQGELKAAFDLLPSYAPYREKAAVGDFYDVTVPPQQVPRSSGWTGGGIEAQADDIARIFRSLFTTVVTGYELTEFLTPSAHSDYALGVMIGEKAGQKVYSHGGGVPGFRSEAVFAPDLDVTVAVSTNLIAIDPDISSLTDALMKIINAAYA